MLFGGAKNIKDFIIITLGTGMGKRNCSERRTLFSGYTGFAGELGQNNNCSGGRACGCGRRDVLERMCLHQVLFGLFYIC